MASPVVSLKIGTVVASADRFRRRSVEAAEILPIIGWRLAAGETHQILIVPQDLRTADPSLVVEMGSGQLGLAGAVAHIDGVSPFAVPPPSPAWEEALHRFEWFRDLRAANTADARQIVQASAQDWIRRYGTSGGLPWRPDVLSRRLISWFGAAGLLLEDADPIDYDRLIRSLSRQVRSLATTWRHAPDGVPRLTALTALVLAGVCLAERSDLLDDHLAPFSAEIDRQILADGSHITRNPDAIVEVLLDLLPLKQCFAARDLEVPPALLGALKRTPPYLRHMRLGDGALAHFNGMGSTKIDRLAMALAFEEPPIAVLPPLPVSHYCRLERGQTIVLLDGTGPPGLSLAGAAHAGVLSFEMSVGKAPLIVNCGAPGPADETAWATYARGTAAHSTLVLNGEPSGRLKGAAKRGTEARTRPLDGPSEVTCQLTQRDDGASGAEAGHNGYVAAHGLIHQRTLRLSASGERLHGTDRLLRGGSAPILRRQMALPFAIHFHVHPSAAVTRSDVPVGALITLGNGQRWRLACKGAEPSLEESLFLAHYAGPVRSVQIVLRGFVHEELNLAWSLDLVNAAV